MIRLLSGDCRELLATLPADSVHCCVTSPPYFGLRDYGVDGQLGLEPTPELYVERMVEVFRGVRRVLRDDGTLWLNIGDSYAATTNGSGGHNPKQDGNAGSWMTDRSWRIPNGLKPKDLIGIPWMLAFALRADGWWLRQDIIWSKPNPMPESITDRCTKAHEYLFLLSKSERYWFDADAIKEDGSLQKSGNTQHKYVNDDPLHRTKAGFRDMRAKVYEKVNRRSVWTIATATFAEAHFATFPPALIEPCILAGCPIGGTLLDPFAGAGTTGLVADRLQRDAVLIELNPAYCAMAQTRITDDAPLFAKVLA